MNKVEIINPIEDKRWDAFVENHPFGKICHLSGWKTVLEGNFPHMKGYYLALVHRNNIKAALPLFSVKSWLTGNRLVSIPYATLFDPLVTTTEEFLILLYNAKKLSQKLGITDIKLKALDSLAIIKSPELFISPFYKCHVLQLNSNPEDLKKSFDRTCVRQKIDRSLKSELHFKIAKDETDLNSFYKLYSATRKRVGLPPQPYSFFRMLWITFSASQKLEVLIAQKGNQDIASLLLLKYKNRVSAEYLGYSIEHLQYNPHHFLFWKAIQTACHDKFTQFDFGRTSPLNVGLMNFKKRWGTQVIDLYELCYPAKNNIKNAFSEESFKYKILRTFCKNSPTYIYNKIPGLIYRHLG